MLSPVGASAVSELLASHSLNPTFSSGEVVVVPQPDLDSTMLHSPEITHCRGGARALGGVLVGTALELPVTGRTSICMWCLPDPFHQELTAVRNLAANLEVLTSPMPSTVDGVALVASSAGMLASDPSFATDGFPVLEPVTAGFGERASLRMHLALTRLKEFTPADVFDALLVGPSHAQEMVFIRVDVAAQVSPFMQPWLPFLFAPVLTHRVAGSVHIFAGLLDTVLAAEAANMTLAVRARQAAVERFEPSVLSPAALDTAMALWDPLSTGVYASAQACVAAAALL